MSLTTKDVDRMIEIKWKRDFGNRADALRIGGYDESPNYYYLQYRDVMERDQDGEVVVATEWQDVEMDQPHY